MLKSANDDTLLPKHQCRTLPVNYITTKLRTYQQWLHYFTSTIVANASGWDIAPIEEILACMQHTLQDNESLVVFNLYATICSLWNSQMHLYALFHVPRDLSYMTLLSPNREASKPTSPPLTCYMIHMRRSSMSKSLLVKSTSADEIGLLVFVSVIEILYIIHQDLTIF